MNNDFLTKNAAALVALNEAARVFSGNSTWDEPQLAVNRLAHLLDAVEALKETSRPEPYIPVEGERVWIQGVVRTSCNDGLTATIEFSESQWDTHTINPRLVPVRPA